MTDRVYGTYRGVVVNNNDPEARGRARMQIPQLFGKEVTDWVEPATIGVVTPPIGQIVWVMFEGGDANYPVWYGMATSQGASASSVPTGALTQYAGSSAPSGWLLCNGSAVSRTTYSSLFAVLGTAYGTGDGSTTFNLPNLTGRTPVGRDAGQTQFNTLGKIGGFTTVALDLSTMPTHSHAVVSDGAHSHGGTTDTVSLNHAHSMAITYASDTTVGGSSFRVNDVGGVTHAAGTAGSATSGFTAPTHSHVITTDTGHTHGMSTNGSGGAHENMPPFVVVNYIIKA